MASLPEVIMLWCISDVVAIQLFVMEIIFSCCLLENQAVLPGKSVAKKIYTDDK